MKQSFLTIFLWITIGISSFLFIIYVGRGIYLLEFSARNPVDLWLRWCDLRYVFERQNPYDLGEIFHHSQKASLSSTHAPRIVHIDPNLDVNCGGGGYPPWAFFWANIFIPPLSWTLARFWFFSVNMACLIYLAIFSWNTTPSNHFVNRLFMMAGVLAVNSIGTTLGNGQFGLILVVLLILAVRWQNKFYGIPSGILYAITLLKPTVGFTYAVIFLVRGRLVLLATAGLLTVSAAFLIGWWVNTNPFEMIQQLFAQTAVWQHIPYSLQDFLPVLGFSNTMNALASLGLALLLSLLLVYKRPADFLLQMAVCGTLARVGPYHQLYDDVMIIFLLLAMGRLFLLRPTYSNGLFYMIIATSLYLPGRLTLSPMINIMHIVIWICGLGWLIYYHNDSRDAERIGYKHNASGFPK